MAIIIVAMYQIFNCVPESFKNSIIVYLNFIFVVLFVVALLLNIMKKHLFKDKIWMVH